MSRRIKSFYWWAVKCHDNYVNTGIYDLISDMKQDVDWFPKSSDYAVNRDYLSHHNACDACLARFEELWSDYYRATRGVPWVAPTEEEDEDE